MIKKMLGVVLIVVMGLAHFSIQAESSAAQVQAIPILSKQEIIAFGDATYLFDHREYNSLTVSGGFKNLPLGFNAWGFIDILSDQNNESNRFDFTRYFLEYRLRRTLDPEWVMGVKGLGLEVEYNDANGANNNLLRFGVNYKHDIPLIAGQKSWLQWRYFPIQTNQYARSQASVVYRLGLTKRLYIRGFADFNIDEDGKNRWVAEPQLHYEIIDNVNFVLEGRINEYEGANAKLTGTGVAFGLQVLF
ncbi:MAG TPA: hypothetical protein EYO51_03305 [Methylococcaceae bacterium]|nr:hypothetical protein [Methylococcaceae bacterium]HIN68028.1 hypothetical protein [Methylococcales bacterium]HIA44628.1 hypothetical protein [Methylococcaceae bacterium]HIB62165.1 hypothetical protein [Methylococcaceae bacterium]HIO13043.1 hypothetical protein [Methylococcales bacterium]